MYGHHLDDERLIRAESLLDEEVIRYQGISGRYGGKNTLRR